MPRVVPVCRILCDLSFSIHLGYDQVVKVRDLIRKLEATGWVLRSTKGSHRQFKHSQKPAVVTVAGHPGKDIPIGTFRAILKAAELEGD